MHVNCALIQQSSGQAQASQFSYTYAKTKTRLGKKQILTGPGQVLHHDHNAV